MLQWIPGVVAAVALAQTPAVPVNPKAVLKPGRPLKWADVEAEAVKGRWTLSRPRTGEDGKVHDYRVELEFTAGKLQVNFFEDNRPKGSGVVLDVVRFEMADGVTRMVLVPAEKGPTFLLRYDVWDQQLVLLGHRPGTRTTEGFSLAGQYQRPKPSK